MNAFDVFFLFGLPVLILAASIIGRIALGRPKDKPVVAMPYRSARQTAVVRFDAGKFVIQSTSSE